MIVTKPWVHQIEAGKWIEERAGSMIAVGMGGGKTLIGAIAIAYLKAPITIILCPARIPAVWNRELARHMPGARIQLCILERKLDGRKKRDKAEKARKLAHLRGEPLIVVVNYEAAWREPLRTWLLKLKPGLLLLDESHRIKAPGGKASMFCYLMGKRAGKRVLLTGTPMPHSPLDLYGQFRAMNPKVFGTSWTSFRSRYARVGGASGTEILEFQNQGELWAKFHEHAFVRSSEECNDMPPITEQVIEFDLSPSAEKIYRKLEARFWADLDDGTVTLANALGRLIRLQQATSGYLPLDLQPGQSEQQISVIDDSKITALADVLEDLPDPRRQPVVVFCRFHYDLDCIAELAGNLGLRYGEVSGRRTDLTDHATMPDDIDLMAVQIQSGGIGIDLTRASVAIFYSTGFSLGDMQQAMARVWRQGQSRHVTVLHLIANGTIDGVIREAHENNWEVIKTILMRRPAALSQAA